LNQSKLGTEKFIELNKPTTQVIDRSGQSDVIQTPGLGGAPTTVRTYSDVPLPENVVAQKKDIARAGSTKITVPVNVSTERKFGEMFGGKIAEEDVLMRAAALKAPEAAANANRILELVQNPNVFTGTGATLKLNIAKALNMTGATDSDSAANTEALISATGQSTLNAIKTAGLGTGQGFTDKDLRFLQGIAGGTIAMEKESIARLADIQHRVAVVTADRWASRKKSIPKSALEGTGLREETITVPPRIAAATSTPKAGIVQDGYRFKGGNPADAKNWEKL
jgi:hypothetical protein